MAEFDASQVQWQAPWQAISPDTAHHYELELQREICAKHVLFGRSVSAVGRRQDCDDTLFYLGDIPPSFAVVHLSYNKETNPEWPYIRLFDSFQAWFEQCMIPDVKDFSS